MAMDARPSYDDRPLYGEIPIRDRFYDDTYSASSSDSESFERPWRKPQRPIRRRELGELASRRRTPKEDVYRGDTDLAAAERFFRPIHPGDDKRDYVPIYTKADPEDDSYSRHRRSSHSVRPLPSRGTVEYVSQTNGKPAITIRRGSGRPRAFKSQRPDNNELYGHLGDPGPPPPPMDDGTLPLKMRRAETMPYPRTPGKKPQESSFTAADLPGPPVERTTRQYFYPDGGELTRSASRSSRPKTNHQAFPPGEPGYYPSGHRYQPEDVKFQSEYQRPSMARRRPNEQVVAPSSRGEGYESRPGRREWMAAMPLVSNTISQDHTVSAEIQQRELLKRVLS